MIFSKISATDNQVWQIKLISIFAQGEIVDKYFKDNKTVIILIGSGIYAGNILGGIMGTALFFYDGWQITGPVTASFHILPLVFLPFIKTYEDEENIAILEKDDKVSPTQELTLFQCVAYYIPDFIFFMNNVGFTVITYVIPLRMFYYNGHSVDVVFYVLNIVCSIAIVPGIAVSYLISKKMDVFYGLMATNVVFYTGSLIMFASTSPYLSFNSDFEISTTLVGMSNASISNLIILSKFVMFERWEKDTRKINLGQHATKVFNATDSLGQIVGAVISGLSLGRGSVVPTFFAYFAFMILTTLLMTILKFLVK